MEAEAEDGRESEAEGVPLTVAPVPTMASVDVSSIVSVVFRWVGIIMHFASISRERMTSLRFICFSHLGRRGFRGSAGGSIGGSEDVFVDFQFGNFENRKSITI